MDNNSFVKIEDKKMPIDTFNYPDLDMGITKNYSSGFANFIFLAGIVATSFMWIMLMFFGK